MFQNLRPNTTLYILHRGVNPYLECAKIISVKNLRTVYKNAPGGLYPQPVQVVDVLAQSGNDSITLTELPAALDITDDTKTGLLVSASRDEMNAEILTMKQKSEEVLKSIDYHKNFLASCDQMLNALNPEYAVIQQREQEIMNLRGQIEELRKDNSDFKDRFTSFMAMMEKQLGVSSETPKNIGDKDNGNVDNTGRRPR